MLTLVGSPDSRSGWKPPQAKPFDEAVWQAWLAKGRGQDARGSSVRLDAVKLAAIVGLLAAAGLWSYVTPYEVAVRFVVTAAAVFVMFHAFRARYYAFAAVFGVLALLYNPVTPVFSVSPDWQRFLLAATTIPFIASLGWRNARTPHHE